MKPTLLVCGHGPGISDAVARRFGREGFAVALVARNADRLANAAHALAAEGIAARAFPCDLADAAAVTALVADVRAALGPVHVVHYNAYGGGGGDLTVGGTEGVCAAFDVAVTGLLAAVQAALPDLKAHRGSVLVTGGGFALYDPAVDAMAVQYNAMGLAVAKAAQHKTAALLHHRLKGDGVYVGEVVVLGMVKGTAFDSGHATLDAADIAQRFWEIHQARAEASVSFR